MSLGDLLIPAILGYWLLTHVHYSRFVAVRDSGYHVLFRSAFVGGFLFGLSETILFFLDRYAPQAQETWERILPADFFSIAVLGCIALVIWAVVNRFYSAEDAQLRVAREMGDVVELLMLEAMEDGKYVELSLRSRKSYIGIPLESGLGRQGQSDISIIPLASGYRDTDTQELMITTHYAPVISQVLNGELLVPLEDFQIAIPMSEVVSARIFHIEAYQLFRRGEPDARFP